MFKHRNQPLKFCKKIYSCPSLPPSLTPPSRPVLWRRSVLGGAAPGLYVPLLRQDGLHRDVPAGACGCRAHRDLHRSGTLWLSFTQQHVWNFVHTTINNQMHLDLCCLTSEEVIFFFLEHALHCHISFTVLLHIVTAAASVINWTASVGK